MATPAEQRPPVTEPVHTDKLPPLPQRESRIPASMWIEAPPSIVHLGDHLGAEAGYIRRIGRYLLWRAGPAAGAAARYGAIDSEDLDRSFTFDLDAEGEGSGIGPDGVSHDRFRSWKESLRDDQAE